MKKIMAIALTVAMLLTCLFAMPVSADTLPMMVSLDIANYSFEADEAGKTITGWTKGYVETNDDKTWNVEAGGVQGSKRIGIKAGNGGDKWLSQDVTIPESIASSIANYTWYFKNHNTYCTYLKLTVYGAEGTAPVTFDYNDFDLRNGNTHESVIDVTSAMKAVANPTKVNIAIGMHNNGGSYDNVRLAGYMEEGSLLKNPNFAFTNADGTVESWKLGTAKLISKNDGTGDNYIFANHDDGVHSYSEQSVLVPDASPYIITIRYKAITTDDAYVKICDKNDGWKVYVETTLPVTDTTATTLEEAAWGTFTKFIYISNNAANIANMDFALRAHPNGTVGAYYDSCSLTPVELNGNFIVNGDFESSNAGDTDVLGWTQNDAGKLATVTADHGGKAISGGAGFKTYVPMQFEMMSKKLYLSFNAQYGGGGSMPAVTVTAHSTAGDKAYTFSSYVVFDDGGVRGADHQSYIDGKAWAQNGVGRWTEEPVVISLEDLIAQAGGRDAVTGFTFNFANSNTYAGAWDDIKLYAKGTLDGNLIENGSFEVANVGATAKADAVADCVGWKQTGTVNMVWKGLTGSYLIPADDGGSFIVYSKPGGSALTQTVVLDSTDDYVKNHEKYRWNLSFSTYAAGSSLACAAVDVTAYKADGSRKKTTTFSGADWPIKTAWTMNAVELDISSALDCFAEPVTKFDITLKAVGNEGGFEAVKLFPEYDADKVYPEVPRYVNVVNPSFEEPLNEDGTIPGWTAQEGSEWTIGKLGDATDRIPSEGTKYLRADKNSSGAKYISQIIEMPTDADYFANMSDYTWKIKITNYYICILDLIVYNHDKTVSATTRYSTYDGRRWGTFDWEWDVTEGMNKVGKASFVELRFSCNNDGQPTIVDNIEFTATKKPVDPNAPVSMIKNGGFEAVDADGNLADWDTSYRADWNLFERVENAVTAPIGKAYAKLTSKANTNEEGEVVDGPYGAIISQKVNVTEGKYYNLTFAYSSADAGAAFVQITNNEEAAIYSQRFAASNGAWLTKQVVFKAPYTGEISVNLRCYPSTSGVSYDNVSMFEHTVDEAALVQEGNLIYNPSFEQDIVGGATIIGWTTSDFPASEVIKDSRASDGNNALHSGMDNLSQVVEITEYDTANGRNYGYTFEMHYNSYNGGYQHVIFDMEFADGTTKSVTIDGFRATAPDSMVNGAGEVCNLLTHYPHQVFVPKDVAIDLTPFTTATVSPLKKIKVTFGSVGTKCIIDNVKLYKNDHATTVAIVDADGAAVADVVTNEAATYAAKVKYYGDANATAYVAAYSVDANGVLRLAGVTTADVVAGVGAESADAVLTGVNAVAGTTVVKAFIWRGDITPVASAVID